MAVMSYFDALRETARHTYGEDAAAYEAGRPPYPERVYQILRERCGLRPGARVVEIGPGTGQVTRHLVDAGADVTAVEPDAGFAAHLTATLPGVTVVPATFEDADLTGGVDLVVAATSFHWVDQAVGLAKVGRLLRPGGWAALWWTVFSDPYREDPLLAAAERGLGFEPGNQRGGTGFQLDLDSRRADLTGHGGLVDAAGELIPWDLPMTAAQVRALYASQITVRQLPDAEQARVLDTVMRLVGSVGTVRPFLTVCYTARKPSPPRTPVGRPTPKGQRRSRGDASDEADC